MVLDLGDSCFEDVNFAPTCRQITDGDWYGRLCFEDVGPQIL